jgi:hypothetical protein
MFDYVHNSQNHQPGDTACQKYCYAAPRAPSEGEGVEGGVPRYTGGERADEGKEHPHFAAQREAEIGSEKTRECDAAATKKRLVHVNDCLAARRTQAHRPGRRPGESPRCRMNRWSKPLLNSFSAGEALLIAASL